MAERIFASLDAPDGLDATVPVLRRMRERVERTVRLLDRMGADPLTPEPPGLPALMDTARRLRHDTEGLLLLAGEAYPRPGGARELSAVLDEAVDATSEPMRVDVRSGVHATIAPDAATELLHVVAEVVEHVIAVHPAGRVEVSYRPDAPDGVVVEVSADGATRYDPEGGQGPGLAAAARMAQRSRSGIVLRIPARGSGVVSQGPIAIAHCPGTVVTVDERGYGASPEPGPRNGRAIGSLDEGIDPAGDRPFRRLLDGLPAASASRGSADPDSLRDSPPPAVPQARRDPDTLPGPLPGPPAGSPPALPPPAEPFAGDRPGAEASGAYPFDAVADPAHPLAGHPLAGEHPLSSDPVAGDPFSADPFSADPFSADPFWAHSSGAAPAGEAARRNGTDPHGSAPVEPPAPRRPSIWDSTSTSAGREQAPNAAPRPTPPTPAPRRDPIDELFGPLGDLSVDLDAPGNTPIFEAVASAWFRERKPSEAARPLNAGPGPLDWESPSDREWRAAAERAALDEEPATFTAGGLPRRRPGGRLVPPRADVNGAPQQPDRVPDRVRERLSGYQRGLRQGRHRAEETGDPGDPAAR